MGIALALLLVAIGLGACGQVLMKSGLRQLGDVGPLQVWRSIVANPRVLGGFVCYGLSSLLYVLAIHRLDLSYAYPMIAAGYVLVVVLSWRFLGEDVPRLRIVGLAIVMLGVLVVALSHAKQKPRGELSAPPAVHTRAPR